MVVRASTAPSPVVVPTKLLPGEIAPEVPVSALIHVTAPTSATAPLSHVLVTATGWPFTRVVRLFPTLSLGDDPTTLFAALTTPLSPVVPFTHVIAPASTAEP